MCWTPSASCWRRRMSWPGPGPTPIGPPLRPFAHSGVDGRCEAAPQQNKALVLAAFDALFNRRDYPAAERLWSDRYIQHSAHIAPGREGLFNLVRALPPTLKYE